MRKLRVEARAKRVPYELPDLAVRVNHAGDEHRRISAHARRVLAQSGAAAAAGSTRRQGPGHDAGGSPVADRAESRPAEARTSKTLTGGADARGTRRERCH